VGAHGTTLSGHASRLGALESAKAAAKAAAPAPAVPVAAPAEEKK
jgi:hypothetical protein